MWRCARACVMAAKGLSESMQVPQAVGGNGCCVWLD
jgi:hypothetical protein